MESWVSLPFVLIFRLSVREKITTFVTTLLNKTTSLSPWSWLRGLSITYCEIVSVEQQFTEQLEWLTPSDVVFRVEEPLIVGEHFVVVQFQEFSAEKLVSS